jgi:uncharacterized cupin superfamily protein
VSYTVARTLYDLYIEDASQHGARRIFGSKRGSSPRNQRKLHNEEQLHINTIYYQDVMGSTCNMYGRDENCKILKGRDHLGEQAIQGEDNIKMDFKEWYVKA